MWWLKKQTPFYSMSTCHDCNVQIVHNNANINLCDDKWASSLLKTCPGDHDSTANRRWLEIVNKGRTFCLGFFLGHKSTVEGLLGSQLAYM